MFGEIRQPHHTYLAVPRVSSQNRDYVPATLESPDTIATDALLIIPDSSLYEFGIIESKVHTVWIKCVAGRLKSDFRYSAKIVYNNFPWPDVDDKQTERISKSAQSIIDARKESPNSSLADLYNPAGMTKPLYKAHEANDKAVMKAYGLRPSATEQEIAQRLFEMYQKLTSN